MRVSRWLAILAVLAFGGGLAMPAQASDELVEATPGPDALLATPPPRLLLLFGAELNEASSTVRVIGPDGRRADRGDVQVDGQRLQVSLRDRGPGAYRVRWRVTPAERGGVSQGEYRFVIQPQLPATAPQLTVQPAVASAGQRVAVAGSGFTPDGDVVLTVGDGADLLTLARADAQGRFRLEVALPDDLPFGRQVVQAADAADHLATAAVWVSTGGTPVAVRLRGEAQADGIGYTLRVENRSEYALHDVVVRADVPQGARVLLEGLGQPEGVAAPVLEGQQLVWKVPALPAHTVLGPFTFQVLVTDLSGRPTLTATATVEYAHRWPPRFRGTAQSPEVRVQVATR